MTYSFDVTGTLHRVTSAPNTKLSAARLFVARAVAVPLAARGKARVMARVTGAGEGAPGKVPFAARTRAAGNCGSSTSPWLSDCDGRTASTAEYSMGVSMCAGLASRPCALADWISLAAKPATNGAAKLVPPRSFYSALPTAVAAEARPGTPEPCTEC